MLYQLFCYVLCKVDGNCKSDSCEGATRAGNRGVNTNHFPPYIQKGATGVSGVYGCIRLEEILIVGSLGKGNVPPVDGAYDTHCNCGGQSEGTSYGYRPLSNLHLVRIPQLQNRKGFLLICEFQYGYVRSGVPSHYLYIFDLGAIVQGDGYVLCIPYHVVVCHYVIGISLLPEYESRTHANSFGNLRKGKVRSEELSKEVEFLGNRVLNSWLYNGPYINHSG